jgi:uncharacterized DUF497 family protein
MPSTPFVEDFAFDEENEEEMAAHGVSPEQLLQVLDRPYRVRKNRRQRRASHLIIGRDRQHQCIAIPIEPTHVRGLWRPVTAWYCKHHEWGWLPPED